MNRFDKTSERKTTSDREVRAGSSPVDRFFKISQRGSTVGREVRGGIVTFFTMAYIIVLNPLILGFVEDGDGNLLGGEAVASMSRLPDITWADAMGLVVMEGLLILVLVLTGFREAVFHAVPGQLKVAISVGIGLFIALIGFVDAGFVIVQQVLARIVDQQS